MFPAHLVIYLTLLAEAECLVRSTPADNGAIVIDAKEKFCRG